MRLWMQIGQHGLFLSPLCSIPDKPQVGQCSMATAHQERNRVCASRDTIAQASHCRLLLSRSIVSNCATPWTAARQAVLHHLPEFAQTHVD